MTQETVPLDVPGREGETTSAPAQRRGIRSAAGRLLKTVGAFFLILFGAIFVITPFIPGWPLVVIGLTMLAAEYAWARRMLMRLPRRYAGRKPPP